VLGSFGTVRLRRMQGMLFIVRCVVDGVCDMACFRPVAAWRLEDGSIFFGAEKAGARALQLPCGRCIGCKLVRSRGWALRCMHEAQMHEDNSFVTLTYSDDFLSPSLNYRDFQLFMKRLRKLKGGSRFFMCGEYGSVNLRPHFHALLFGVRFNGLDSIGTNLFRSGELERLWPYGFSSIGSVTYESAGYVARYSLKKVVGVGAFSHYCRVDRVSGEYVQVVPEFARMSLKPGIGFDWFRKYWKEVYGPRDGVVLVGGRVSPAPRYYDQMLEVLYNDVFEDKKRERYVNGGKFVDECTPERLAVRELCAKAKLAFKSQRSL